MPLALLYMVAGMSSRFGGKIKQFAQVGPNGETLIEYSLDQALKTNSFDKIIFVVGNKTEKPFKVKFGNEYKGIPVEYALQKFDPEKRNRPWGTQDALCSAIDLIDDEFVAANGDEIYGEEAFQTLVNHSKISKNPAIVGYILKNSLPETGTVNRGIIIVDKNKNVIEMKEFKGISKETLASHGLNEESLCNMNLLYLNKNILEELNKKVIKFKEEHQGNRDIESMLPDNLSQLTKEGKMTMKVYISDYKSPEITNPDDELTVRMILSKK
ncbi:hypothetical protein HYT24_00105 [Candidatus Pacearchaeota archaeon]|nr:hypothetical protein [Candidatus Pacearchaeota archaeon]